MQNLTIYCYLTALDVPRRIWDRCRGDERGQTTAEYAGLILLMVVILGLLASFAGKEIATAIGDAVKAAMEKVKEKVGG
ncbi:MAG TPA: hypothetical protein VG455_12195 [Acidimicrobiales bacterium]|nr:hypothetical protein [Acidimicrobiales bacterium]